jgi:hypothetical protein
MDGRPLLAAAHDLGLAAWFGGAWMGAVALNSATIEVDDHTQRIRVANAGWFAWAPVTALSISVHVGSALRLRRLVPTVWRRGTPALTRARTAVTGLALVATAATGVEGRRVMRAGDVPVATAVRAISETPDEVARAQGWLRLGQWAVPVLTGAVWVVNAFQERRGLRPRSD